MALYTIDGGGHTWPNERWLPRFRSRGGVTRVVDGASVLWEFFAKHPKTP